MTNGDITSTYLNHNRYRPNPTKLNKVLIQKRITPVYGDVHRARELLYSNAEYNSLFECHCDDNADAIYKPHMGLKMGFIFENSYFGQFSQIIVLKCHNAKLCKYECTCVPRVSSLQGVNTK